jgi:uncharacterized protein
MNSCAYVCKLKHNRPNKNKFGYGIYLWYLDLDELDILSKKFFLYSNNKFNLLSFYDDDHFLFVKQKGYADKIARETFDYTRKKYIGKNIKQKVREAVKELNLDFELGKVYLLTNLRNVGYIFNPVSFYYCYDKKGNLRALLSEVNNTFREQKLYHAKVNSKSKEHKDKQRKNFYISPFIDVDTEITWNFREPKTELFMQVNSLKNGKPILTTDLRGKRKELSNLKIILLFLRYPMMPLIAIILIHWQALKLFIKKVGYRNKKKSDEKIVKVLK